jgi:hypothetical protein
MVLVITFYMLLEGAVIKRAFLALVPREEPPRLGLMLQRIGLHFGGWLRGQLLIALLSRMLGLSPLLTNYRLARRRETHGASSEDWWRSLWPRHCK